MRRIFQRSKKSTLVTGSASGANLQVRAVRGPAIALAFLLAIVMSVLAIRSSQSLQSQSSDYNLGAAVDSQTGATEQNKVENDDSGSESTAGEAKATVDTGGNTVTTRTTVENGQASVQMEVNDEEVPINQNGTTQRTITDDNGQTNINVNVQNGQSTGSGFSSSFTSNSSTSTLNSSTFQSQTVWSSP